MKEISILLAEDHVVVRESIKKLLDEVDDFKVVGEASDGAEAVRLAQEKKPKVVIMDISMPNVNGIEATKEIKRKLPSATILILTAYDYDQYVFALLEAGAAGYLLKDVNSQELIKAIYAVCRGESVLHPAVAGKVMRRFYSQPAYSHSGCGAELTSRENEVLQLAARGLKNKEIAEKLFVSVRTVEAHLGSIFQKFDVGSRTEAILYALRTGWLTIDDLDNLEGEDLHISVRH